MIPEPLRVILAVAKALERMEIPYFVGGSLASSTHGVARATLDADIVARLEPQHAGRDLDGSYLSLWAGELGVADLLARALSGREHPRPAGGTR